MDHFTIDEEYQLKLNSETKLWDTYQYGQLLSKNAKKLFKYYSLNLYNIDCLLRTYFYLANPVKFNDPFDCNLNLMLDMDNVNHIKTVKNNNFKDVGICSFSETIDNHLMWAHYTNNYNGFALEFDGENIDIKLDKEKIKRYTLTRIIYPKKPIRISQKYSFALHYLLTTKFSHWSYEKEWRIITELNSSDRTMPYFPESIKGIYIGHKIPDENKSAYNLLLEIQEIRFPKTPVYVVYPHPTDLKLKFEKVWN